METMKSFFQDLYTYQHHFNVQLFERLEQEEAKLPAKVIPLFSHMINAHQIWNGRILGLPTLGVFDVHPLADLRELLQTNHNNSLLIIERANFDQVILYLTSRGESFSNTIQDLLFHVINHTTYHRGQIMAELRQAGLEPLVSDYVFYRRH